MKKNTWREPVFSQVWVPALPRMPSTSQDHRWAPTWDTFTTAQKGCLGRTWTLPFEPLGLSSHSSFPSVSPGNQRPLYPPRQEPRPGQPHTWAEGTGRGGSAHPPQPQAGEGRRSHVAPILPQAPRWDRRMFLCASCTSPAGKWCLDRQAVTRGNWSPWERGSALCAHTLVLRSLLEDMLPNPCWTM